MQLVTVCVVFFYTYRRPFQNVQFRSLRLSACPVKSFVTVHGFKGSGVQGCILVPGLHFGGVFM